jgi:hypothetical protein
MVEFLSKVSAGELIAIISIVGGLVCGTIVMIGDYWYKIRKAELQARLKQDMLDRGMSVDEIRDVLEAGTKASKLESCGR